MADRALYVLFALLHSQKFAWKRFNPRHTPGSVWNICPSRHCHFKAARVELSCHLPYPGWIFFEPRNIYFSLKEDDTWRSFRILRALKWHIIFLFIHFSYRVSHPVLFSPFVEDRSYSSPLFFYKQNPSRSCQVSVSG